MTRTCTICRSGSRQEIDRALLQGESERSIAKQFSVSPAAVHRHKTQHLSKTLAKAEEKVVLDSGIDLVAQLKTINSAAMAVLEKARKDGHDHTALGAIDRVAKQIELQAKLLVSAGQMLSIEQVMALADGVIMAIRKHVKDEETLQGIKDDIDGFIGSGIS